MKTVHPTIPKVEPPQGPFFLQGFEAQSRPAVDIIVSDKATIARCEAQILEQRAPLEAWCERLRAVLETQGAFTKTIYVKGTQQNLALTFADAYKPIDVAKEAELQALLGPYYEALFERKTEVLVKDGKAFLACLAQGQGGQQLRDQLIITEYLAPVAEFRECRARLREKLSYAQNLALDSVVVQTANRPQLTVK